MKKSWKIMKNDDDDDKKLLVVVGGFLNDNNNDDQTLGSFSIGIANSHSGSFITTFLANFIPPPPPPENIF